MWQELRANRIISKSAAWLVGYDIFISYRHADAYAYAKELERIMTSKGFLVFRDESAEDAGTPLSTFIERACASRTLVVLVTPGVFQSIYVESEISAYVERCINTWYKRPFSRIIPIDVDRALSAAVKEAPTWRGLIEFVYEAETLQAVESATPSGSVVDRLCRSASFLRSWRWFVIVITSVAASTVVVSILASSYLAWIGEKLSQTSSELQGATTQLQVVTSTNQKLTIETAQLEKQRSMLVIHNAAIAQLDRDTSLAYRLAELAYDLEPNLNNRRLFLKAVSKLDMPYVSKRSGYSIEAMAYPYVLLRNAGGTPVGSSVYHLETGEIVSEPAAHDAKYVIPVRDGWRTLSHTFPGRFQLLDRTGVAIGDALAAVNRPPAFVTATTALFGLSKSPQYLRWDLVNDQRTSIAYSPPLQIDGVLGSDCEMLAARIDGAAAVYVLNRGAKLTLVHSDGRVDLDSQTSVSFDPVFSRAQWSADGRFLVVQDTSRHGIGVWDPTEAAFRWLDPDGWLGEAYAWSTSGHQLAFAGRNRNDDNVTIATIDLSEPDSRSVILHSTRAPVRQMEFVDSNELAFADSEGRIAVLSLKEKKILLSGNHPGISKILARGERLYSSSAQDFRAWSIRSSPARHWSFTSTEGMAYLPVATADSGWKWLAVAFWRKDAKRGLEIRNVATGDKIELDVSPAPRAEVPQLGLPREIQFTPNGKWLILLAPKSIQVYDTEKWKSSVFELPLDDGLFEGFSIVNDTLFSEVSFSNLHKDPHSMVAWSGPGARSRNEGGTYDYAIELRSEGPTLARRGNFAGEVQYVRNVRAEAARDEFKGWSLGSLDKFTSAGVISISNCGWAYHVKSRDEALIAQDCDIQFIPTDMERVKALYDPLIWKPSREELQQLADDH